MTVKIVRVANGEDIIADVQEAYPSKEVYAPIGYFLTNPYQVIVCLLYTSPSPRDS